MKKPHIKAVLFDWDLTLVHAFPVARRALKKVGSRYQVDLSGVTMRSLYEQGYESVLTRIHNDYHDMLPDKETFIKVISEELVHGHRALELTYAPLLKRFRKRGLKLGLVTYNVIENVRAVLKKSDFHFDVYVTSVEMNGHVNKAKGLQQALDALQVASHEALYIGDTIDDIVSAHQVGITVVTITTGVYSREELQLARPSAIIDHMSELEALVEHGIEPALHH